MRVLIFTFVFFLTSVGFARVSERNFQAKSGQSFIQGNLIRTNDKVEIPTDPGFPEVELDIDDSRFSLQFERGLSDSFAMYGGIGFGSAEFKISSPIDEDSSDVRGLDPINLGLKFQKANDKGRFFSRANLAFGLQDSETDSDGDSNRTSNVFVLNLKLGYEAFVSEKNTFGASVAYSVITTDAKSEDDEDVDTDGNAELSIYYENLNDSGLVLGGHLDYKLTSFFEQLDYHGEDIDFSIIELGAYARAPLSTKLFLLGSLDYGLSVDEPEGTDDFTRLRVSLGLRLLL